MNRIDQTNLENKQNSCSQQIYTLYKVSFLVSIFCVETGRACSDEIANSANLNLIYNSDNSHKGTHSQPATIFVLSFLYKQCFIKIEYTEMFILVAAFTKWENPNFYSYNVTSWIMKILQFKTKIYFGEWFEDLGWKYNMY